jgi:hypothetical protein
VEHKSKRLPVVQVNFCPTPVTPDSYGDILKRLANLENCVDHLCARVNSIPSQPLTESLPSCGHAKGSKSGDA